MKKSGLTALIALFAPYSSMACACASDGKVHPLVMAFLFVAYFLVFPVVSGVMGYLAEKTLVALLAYGVAVGISVYTYTISELFVYGMPLVPFITLVLVMRHYQRQALTRRSNGTDL